MPPAFSMCPNCGESLASDEVYRAEYEDASNQHLMPPREDYCDHIKYSNSCRSTTEDHHSHG